MTNRNRTQFPATTFTDILVVLGAILLLGIVAGLLDGCASEVPRDQICTVPPGASVILTEQGYQDPGSGFPAAVCTVGGERVKGCALETDFKPLPGSLIAPDNSPVWCVSN